MNFTRICLIAVFVLSCLCCAPAKTALSAAPTTFFERIDDSVIALVWPNKHSEGYHIACSGVWISPSEFLSAAHCADLTLSEDEEILSTLNLFPDLSGRVMRFVDWRSTANVEWSKVKNFRDAVILDVDHDKDLALFSVIGKPGPHSVMRLASTNAIQGDSVWAAGHTLGLAYSVAPGAIGAVRTLPGVVTGAPGKYYQVTGSISYGNSGGALVDLNGDLLGICSFRVQEDPISFFSYTDTIRAFIDSNS